MLVHEGFHVEIRGDHIVVTFVGTSFCVAYPKPKEGQALFRFFKERRCHLSANSSISLRRADARAR